MFDRGVTTDCPVTFIHPIGGYAFGADAAEFLKEKVKQGGKILALRILPGVDVLETRWSGAKGIFDEAGLNVVGVEFTDGDPAKTKSIVVRLPPARRQPRRRLDGRRRDRRRRHRGVRGRRPGRPADHRRGPERLPDQVEGRRPDGRRPDVLELPVAYGRHRGDRRSSRAKRSRRSGSSRSRRSRRRTLDQYVKPNMPPLYYALCGCEDLPGFPEKWGGK